MNEAIECTKEMQTALQKARYYMGGIDGIPGAITQGAFRRCVDDALAEQRNARGRPDAEPPAMNSFSAAKAYVRDRGHPPDVFLTELVAWGRNMPDEIVETNADPDDVFNRLLPLLGPWQGMPGTTEWLRHRKAVMLELLRCLAGFESSWNWNCGVDTTNAASLRNVAGQETGIFQVSYDSLGFDGVHTPLHDCVIAHCGSVNVQTFIDTMKSRHEFALEYCARLLRFAYQWDGPILRHEIDSSLSLDSVKEFQALLA